MFLFHCMNIFKYFLFGPMGELNIFTFLSNEKHQHNKSIHDIISHFKLASTKGKNNLKRKSIKHSDLYHLIMMIFITPDYY